MPYGYDHKYTYSNLGYNLKVTDIQAAIGLAQFDRLEDFVDKRRKNFFILKNQLADLKKYFILPQESKGAKPSWFGFPITIRNRNIINRNNLINFLEDNNIGTRLLFSGNITKQPYMLNQQYRVSGDLKISDKIMNNSFWVGVYPGLRKNNISFLSNVLHKYIEKYVVNL